MMSYFNHVNGFLLFKQSLITDTWFSTKFFQVEINMCWHSKPLPYFPWSVFSWLPAVTNKCVDKINSSSKPTRTLGTWYFFVHYFADQSVMSLDVS